MPNALQYFMVEYYPVALYTGQYMYLPYVSKTSENVSFSLSLPLRKRAQEPGKE